MHRPRLGFVLAFITTATPVAADDDWKDGCPFFDDDPLPVSGRFGISPVPDTALGPSRIALQYDRAQATVPIDPASETASNRAFVQPWTNVGQIVAQLNLRSGPTLTVHYGGVHAADLQHLGNVGAALGYRYTDFGFDGAVRWGVALRLGEDVSATAADCTVDSMSPACVTRTGMRRDQHHDDLLSATIRSPFNARWFAFDRVVSGVAEARVEMVGCHSPFVHLRVEASRWRGVGLQSAPRSLETSPMLHAIPITLAIGGYVGPHVGAAGEIGVEFRGPTSILLAHRVERYRALLDLRIGQHFELSFYAGAVSGDAQGVELGVTFSGKLQGDDLRGDEGIQ